MSSQEFDAINKSFRDVKDNVLVPAVEKFDVRHKEVWTDPQKQSNTTTHYSEVPGELISKRRGSSSEQVVESSKIEKGRTEGRKLSHRLDELVNDFYLFALGPAYVGASVDFDLLFEFGKALRLDSIKDIILLRSPVPIFHGIGEWGTIIQGIPVEHKIRLQKYLKQLVFMQRNRQPKEYWRLNYRELKLCTPGVVCSPAPVDVYVPSGIDFRYEPEQLQDGTVGFIKSVPEAYVAREALRAFNAGI